MAEVQRLNSIISPVYRDFVCPVPLSGHGLRVPSHVAKWTRSQRNKRFHDRDFTQQFVEVCLVATALPIGHESQISMGGCDKI